MYENGKMRHTETIPGMKGGWEKETDEGVNSTVTFCRCHNTPPAQQ
jgi:hypothetical protein